MYRQASLSIAKVAVLASLLFISNSAYAQDLPKKWKHGWGIHSLRVLDFPVPVTSGRGFQTFEQYQWLIGYAPRRDWETWSLDLGIGAGLNSPSYPATYLPTNTRTSFDVQIDYYASVSPMYKLSNNVSMGPAFTYYKYTASGPYVNFNDTNDEVSLKISVFGKNPQHAFVMFFGPESSTLGYRWSR